MESLPDWSNSWISPRQRVEMALQHEEPDRVPFDFWAVPEVWAALRAYLGVADDEAVLCLSGVDCRLFPLLFILHP